MTKFYVGDVVRLDPMKRTGFKHWFENDTDGVIREIMDYDSKLYGQRATIDWTDSQGLARVQIVPLKELINVSRTAEPEPSENPSRLVLMRAEFKDSEGRNVVVKRSPCRHYYVKVDGSKQQRVSLQSIKQVVENV